MKSLMVKGRRYRVLQRPATRAFCSDPALPNPTLEIPTHGDTEGDLNVILHEILHAGCWDLSEYTVDAIATAQARALWRLGWRKE